MRFPLIRLNRPNTGMGDYQRFLSAHPAFSTFTEGVGRGFLLYFIPFTVLKRDVKKNIMRRALAMGGFCGVVRLIRYYTQYEPEMQEECFERSADLTSIDLQE